METVFQFFLKESSSPEEAIEELCSHSIKDIYSIEDLECSQVILSGRANASQLPAVWEHICSVQKELSHQIDWDSQWQTFSPYYQDGLCFVPLHDFSPSSHEVLTLEPGPGFGDLSHPTTRLALSCLDPLVKNKCIIDLGCGSGILTLAALKIGAEKAISVDIDPDALIHATHNALLNDLEDKIIFTSSLEFFCPIESESVLLMNMTFYEQKAALSSFSPSYPIFSYWVTSGILEEQVEPYLDWILSFGLSLEKTISDGSWYGFVFKKIQN